MNEETVKRQISIINAEDKPYSAALWEITPIKMIKGNPDKRESKYYKTSRFVHATFYKSISKLL